MLKAIIAAAVFVVLTSFGPPASAADCNNICFQRCSIGHGTARDMCMQRCMRTCPALKKNKN